MTGLTTDRSGRTLEDYRSLYWEAERDVTLLRGRLSAAMLLPDKWRRTSWHNRGVDECIDDCADELDTALGKRVKK